MVYEMEKHIDSLDLEGEPKYYLMVTLDLAEDLERLQHFLSDWEDGLVEPYAMAEGNVEWRPFRVHTAGDSVE